MSSKVLFTEGERVGVSLATLWDNNCKLNFTEFL